MTHKFSLAYLTVPGVTPPEQTYMAAKAGYEYVSFRLFHLNVAGEPDIDPTSPSIMRDTKMALANTGLSCLDIELLRIVRGLDPKKFLPTFEAGAELGAKHVICSAWTDVRNDRNYITEVYAEICEMARPFGLTVNLEFPAFSRLTTLDEVAEILTAANVQNAGILVDTLYMHFNRRPLSDLQRVPASWVNFLHICDAQDVVYTKEEMIHIARDARLYPGEGVIDFSQINDLFPDTPLSIELPNATRSGELGHAEHARRCLAAARETLSTQITKKIHKIPA